MRSPAGWAGGVRIESWSSSAARRSRSKLLLEPAERGPQVQGVVDHRGVEPDLLVRRGPLRGQHDVRHVLRAVHERGHTAARVEDGDVGHEPVPFEPLVRQGTGHVDAQRFEQVDPAGLQDAPQRVDDTLDAFLVSGGVGEAVVERAPDERGRGVPEHVEVGVVDVEDRQVGCEQDLGSGQGGEDRAVVGPVRLGRGARVVGRGAGVRHRTLRRSCAAVRHVSSLVRHRIGLFPWVVPSAWRRSRAAAEVRAREPERSRGAGARRRGPPSVRGCAAPSRARAGVRTDRADR